MASGLHFFNYASNYATKSNLDSEAAALEAVLHKIVF